MLLAHRGPTSSCSGRAKSGAPLKATLGGESMSNDDEERILELLRREASHGRQHTSDSSWHDRSPAGKSLVERAWFNSLIVELEADGACPYKPAIASDDEWPDCEASLVGSGGRVAVEVSEVVRGTSLAPGGRPEPWTREQFLESVQSRITEKDGKGFHGGRFAEYMVLLHTDEFFLVQEWVEPALQGVTFNLPHGTIDTAYLILGYRGGRRAYFRLSLAAQQRIASDAPQAARA